MLSKKIQSLLEAASGEEVIHGRKLDCFLAELKDCAEMARNMERNGAPVSGGVREIVDLSAARLRRLGLVPA